MKKFRKKPIVIMAEQFVEIVDTDGGYYLNVEPLDTGADQEILEAKGGPCNHCGKLFIDHGWINTLEGGHIACPDDWIIKGIKGEYYPCKPDIFEATYEEVKEED